MTASSGWGSIESGLDERKRKRMVSNRESRRSRMRKQKQMEDLRKQVKELKNENHQLEQRINAITQKYVEIESGNNVMRAQVMKLTERLKSLNSVLRVVEECSGVDLDIPEIPADPPLNLNLNLNLKQQPWQRPCSASAPTNTIITITTTTTTTCAEIIHP